MLFLFQRIGIFFRGCSVSFFQSTLLLFFVQVFCAPLFGSELLKFHTVDIGTGLSVYIEAPVSHMSRPLRLIIDGGISPQTLSQFLAHPKVNLPPVTDGSKTVIDYLILTHPHADHLRGLQKILENYKVRNIIESKQESAPGYLRRFKAPALQNIIDHGGNYYVVGLPYPRGFDRPLNGKKFNEYRIAEKNLPSFLTDLRRAGEFTTQVKAPPFPFYPKDVEQEVLWPTQSFFSLPKEGSVAPRTMTQLKELRRQLNGKKKYFSIKILPIGTRFQLDDDVNFTIVHGDSYAGLNGRSKDRDVYGGRPNSRYQQASYYGSYDANDLSLALRFRYKNTSYFIAGDTEGRPGRPTGGKGFSLPELFETTGSVRERIQYRAQDIEAYLAKLNAHPLVDLDLSDFKYVGETKGLLKSLEQHFVSYNLLAPVSFPFDFSGKTNTVPARSFADRSQIKSRLDSLFSGPDFQWDYLFSYHQTLTRNYTQTHSTLRQRFRNWIRSGHLRCASPPGPDCAFRPNTDDSFKKWDVVRVMQLANRLYFSDPDYARFLAAVTLNSPFFQEYLKQEATRSELHMMHLADQVDREGYPEDLLKSDVHIFGHHGSFTSSSLPFIQRIDPNVGVISADDRNYSGSNLPDFQMLFWGLNTLLPGIRDQLLVAFAHSDIQHFVRDRKKDLRGRSRAVEILSELRGVLSIPIWRTDWNDDTRNANYSRDHIRIVTDGSLPVFQWSRWSRNSILSSLNQVGFDSDITKGAYFDFRIGNRDLDLGDALPLQILVNRNSKEIRPEDPFGEFSTFSTEGL